MKLALFRKLTWVLCALCAGLLAGLLILGGRSGGQPPSSVAESRPIGGPFTMIAHTGETVTERTYAGKAWMVFMGFTNCPEICPTTLAEMSSWFGELGKEGDGVQGFLVSVDPERDSLETLGLYMSSFDKRIVALRPEPAELERFAKAFKVYYKKVPTEGGDYTMDHTAGVLLFDRQGRFSGMIDMHESREVILQKIRRAIAAPAATKT